MMELIGLLMIEQIISELQTELQHISHQNSAHPPFIFGAVDFFRTYADEYHHGKEEDKLFAELAKKNLTIDHKRIMNELVEEHRYARKTVRKLVAATEKWSNGDSQALVEVSDNLRKLCELYPRHIEKEDKHFFIPCQKYFSVQERESLLLDGNEFDKRFTNTTYKDRMKSLLEH